MRAMRRHVSVGFFIIMCALTRHSGRSAPSAAPGRSARRESRQVLEVLRQVDESWRQSLARTAAPQTPTEMTAVLQERDLRNINAVRAIQTDTVMFPRDPSKKEKFLKHITGPLYFSPKCRKQVYRLYHHTRDCTIPAYVKRCARLLTRLAGSPQCTVKRGEAPARLETHTLFYRRQKGENSRHVPRSGAREARCTPPCLSRQEAPASSFPSSKRDGIREHPRFWFSPDG